MVQGEGSFRLYRTPEGSGEGRALRSPTQPWEGEVRRRSGVGSNSNLSALHRMRSYASDRLERAPSGSQYERSPSHRSTASGTFAYNGTYVDFQQGDDGTLCVVVANTQPNMSGKCISAFTSMNLKVLKVHSEREESEEDRAQRTRLLMTICDDKGNPVLHEGVLTLLKEKILTALQVPIPTAESIASLDRSSSGSISVLSGSSQYLSDDLMVEQIMSKPVVTISAEDTVQAAIDLMNKYNISSLIVFTGRNRAPGIITKRDYVTRVMGEGRDIATTLVEEAMTQPVACIPAKTTIYECSRQMKRMGIRRLVVVDNWSQRRGDAEIDRYVGIVSDSDLFNEMAKLRGTVQRTDMLDRGGSTLSTLKPHEHAEPAGSPSEEVGPSLAYHDTRKRWRTRGQKLLTKRQSEVGQESESEGGSSVESGGAGGPGRESDDHAEEDAEAGPRRERIPQSIGANWEIKFSDIELLGRVGVGGFGEVQRGKWKGADVAVKRLWGLNDEDSGLEMNAFAREVEILASLRHPHIVLFMGACFVHPDIALVMEYCHRGSLDKLLHGRSSRRNRDSPSEKKQDISSTAPELSIRQRLKFALQVAKGMQFLHEMSPPIVHRDLKPANLLLTSNYDVKVCDFGLSKIISRCSHSYMTNQSRHTVGTPHYASPELLKNEKINLKVDVWSFGVVLWELVMRQRPLSHYDDAVQVAAAVAFREERVPLDIFQTEATPPDERDPDKVLVDSRILKLIDTSCSLDIKARPPFAEIVDELKSVLTKSRVPEINARGGQ